MSRYAFYHRMAKIEAVSGVDLSSAESRTSLHLALLSLDAIREPTRSSGRAVDGIEKETSRRTGSES